MKVGSRLKCTGGIYLFHNFFDSAKMSLENCLLSFRRFQERLRLRERLILVPMTRLADRENPLETFDAFQFKMRFHVKEHGTLNCALIEPGLRPQNKRDVNCPFYTSVFQYSNPTLLVLLNWWLVNTLSQPTMSKLIKKVSVELAKLIP